MDEPAAGEEALEAWSHAERAYLNATGAYFPRSHGLHQLDKAGLIRLIQLRSTADAHREAYFLACQAIRAANST